MNSNYFVSVTVAVLVTVYWNKNGNDNGGCNGNFTETPHNKKELPYKRHMKKYCKLKDWT